MKKKQHQMKLSKILSVEKGNSIFNDYLAQNEKTIELVQPPHSSSWVEKFEFPKPKYPVYIISKGRHKNPITSKWFLKCNIHHYMVVEKFEFEQYKESLKDNDHVTLLILPEDVSGSGCGIPARNFCWEHSLTSFKSTHHWIFDDNIRGFGRKFNGIRRPLLSSVGLHICEDLVDRYTNIGIIGFNYKHFSNAKQQNAFSINTRVYSGMLIYNNLPFRWRGRFNEDTDLSLRVLKTKKFCTILLNNILINKDATMKDKGGNTELYKNETNNREEFVDSLIQQHPDVVKKYVRFNRIHHLVDYSSFVQPLEENKEYIKPLESFDKSIKFVLCPA